MIESFDWHPRHQKTLQHAVLYHFDLFCWYSFIVVLIRSRQLDTCQFAKRRVVRNAQELWQHLLPTFFVNVCPSSSSFCRWPSKRCPSTSWKKTAAARPLKSAGPSYGSATGALRNAFKSTAILSTFSASSFSLGNPLGDGA